MFSRTGADNGFHWLTRQVLSSDSWFDYDFWRFGAHLSSNSSIGVIRSFSHIVSGRQPSLQPSVIKLVILCFGFLT